MKTFNTFAFVFVVLVHTCMCEISTALSRTHETTPFHRAMKFFLAPGIQMVHAGCERLEPEVLVMVTLNQNGSTTLPYQQSTFQKAISNLTDYIQVKSIQIYLMVKPYVLTYDNAKYKRFYGHKSNWILCR